MWICSRCQAENSDAYTQCTQCASLRSHRRFAGQPTVTPSLQPQPPERRMRAAEGDLAQGRPPYAPDNSGRPSYAAPENPARKAYAPAENPGKQGPAPEGSVRLSHSGPGDRGAAPPRAPGALVRFIGLTLAVLLPLVVVALAILNQAHLRPLVAGWFAPAGEMVLSPTGVPIPPAPSPLRTPAFGWAAYALMTFAAMLLSMAPGLALWAQGRLLRYMRQR